MAGIGMLVARTPDEATPPTRWHSLNVARLHVSEWEETGVLKPLTVSNAIRVRAGSIEGQAALVDPVAQQVAEISGIRTALISYDNRSLVGVMGDDQTIAAPDGAPLVARRIEAYGAPPAASGIHLPALSFGHVFHLCPYVIGQGGALPPWLRAKLAEPFERARDLDAIDPPQQARRRAVYRRTRGVGAPVLLPPGGLPGIPDRVVPLAGELPIRPPPVSIGRGIDGRFFMSEDGTSGVIDPAPVSTGEVPGLRIEIGGITFDAGQSDLTISLYGRPAAGQEPQLLATLTVPALAANSRLRIDAFADGWRHCIATGEPEWAEDEPTFADPVDTPDPRLSNLSQWRAIAVHVGVGKTSSVSLEPPLVTHLVRRDGAADPLGRPRIAPESSHAQRAVHVLDGINRGTKPEAGRQAFTLRFRRPTVDYGTYERWLNAALIEKRGSDGERAHIDKVLPAAKRLSEEEDARAGEARTLDDPAVSSLHVELVRIFPKFESLGILQIGSAFDGMEHLTGFTRDGKIASMPDHSVKVRAETAADGLSAEAGVPIARLLPGNIYELRVYGGVPPAQPAISALETGKRLSQAVRGVMRRHRTGAGEVRFGAPLVFTLEVATEKMPEKVFQGASGESAMGIAVLRPPLVAAEVAQVRLETGFANTDRYPALRYCGEVALVPQRWSWRGRPQSDDWSDPRSPTRFAMAFSDRGDDDVGMLLTRRLERAHVYGGRRRLADRDASVAAPALFERDLDWQGGVALWRFGLIFESRYAPMRQADPAFMRRTHRAESKNSAWDNLLIGDRANDRTPKRPAFVLALPLTEPLMAPGAVPPLLLLFNEGFHANFHAGDDIEVAIEVARHPFTARERIDERIEALDKAIASEPAASDVEEMKAELARAKEERARLDDEPTDVANLKYWQEHGPDPIRSGTGSGGALLPIRVDGPIGYTFDVGTEAGRFDHTGFLVSPVRLHPAASGRGQAATWPWSLVKLRCRRLEAPEGIDPEAILIAPGPATSSAPQLLKPQATPITEHASWRVANTRPRPAEPAGKDKAAKKKGPRGEAVFATEHEGLVIDLANLRADGKAATFGFAFADEPTEAVSVHLKPAAWGVSITFMTALGWAGTQTLSLRPHETGRLRLVVSLRDKPQDGTLYRPAGDISARVRIVGNEDLVQESTGRWLTLATIPLVSSNPVDWHRIDDPVRVRVATSGDAAQAMVRPVRLSGFTPSVWCQFAESMSMFRATTLVDGRLELLPELVAHSALKATLAATAPQMTLSFAADAPHAGKLAGLHPLDDLARAPEEKDTAQMEEVLTALVTRYVRDVFDRIRERPVAVKMLDPAGATGLVLDLSAPDWPQKTLRVGELGTAGRLRLLRVLRPKPRERGGFVDEVPVFPRDYFGADMLTTPLEMNPADARGMLLGISMPIEWGKG